MRAVSVLLISGRVPLYTVLGRKVKTRLRDPASWLPLDAGASSRNLVFTF